MAELRETYYIGSEATRRRAIEAIAAAPIYDGVERQLVVVVKRAATKYGASKKRRFHAYVNLLADYKDVAPLAMKQTLKAHLCPLVEEVDLVTGETKYVPKGISQLTDQEAADLCEKTVRLARENWGLPLPVTEPEWEAVKYRGLEALTEDYVSP